MGIKNTIKSIIGEQRVTETKGQALHCVHSAKIILRHGEKLDFDPKFLEVYRVFSDPDYHIFRGYYDLDHIDRNDSMILCHRAARKAGRSDAPVCEVGYYHLSSGEFVKISETKAWCWQQGSRLRWAGEHQVIFNAADEHNYCARIYDIHTRELIRQIDHALYDVSEDFSFSITLNFSRLQKMRPGYGYSVFPDPFEGEKAPAGDGLFLVDLVSGETKLLFSLEKLAETADPEHRYTHYLNHLSISPDGRRFMFFHIYKEEGQKGWYTVLYVSDRDGNHLTALEKTDRASHYCWIDSTHLMITCRRSSGTEYYCVFDVISGEKKVLDINGLNSDGHPSRIGRSSVFVTDTYPKEMGLQHLMLFKEKKAYAKKIASLYHDDRLRGEKRCDLHPSVSEDGKWLSVDTTFQNGLRNVVLFSIIPGR